jgi:uncharacterized membrane protein (DUF4010 family)
MDFTYLLFKVLLALGLGGLIGIDRERAHQGYPAGIRTLAFISLLGMLTSFTFEVTQNSLVIPVGLGMIFLLSGASYAVTLFKNKSSIGLTSTIIIIITYLVGVISFFEEYFYLAVAVSIITTLVLTEKERLHNFVRNLSQNELLDALKFGIVAFVILPLLPNTTIDPLGVLNPYKLWLTVVIILSISFIGYAAAKIVGPSRGIFLSGLFGGLASSTGVTTTLSSLSRKDDRLVDACALGISLSWSIMFIRTLVELYLVKPEIVMYILAPFLAAGVAGILVSYLVYKMRVKDTNAELVHNSPFNFIPALKFVVILAVMLVAAKLAMEGAGELGIYATSFLSAMFDVTPAVLSIASLAGTTISLSVARNAIIIASISNTLVKLGMTLVLGRKELFKHSIIYAAFLIIVLITAFFFAI